MIKHNPTSSAHASAWSFALGAALALTLNSPGYAATTFTLDTNRSVMVLTGTIGGAALVEQAPGSLMGHYAGKLEVEVTDSTLRLLSGSAITALNGGEWEPLPGGEAGRAPANYAGVANVTMLTVKPAIRGGGLDFSGGTAALADGQFSCEGLLLKPAASTKLDFNYGLGGDSQALTETLTNTASAKGTLKAVGATLVLTLPVDASGNTVVEDQDVQYRVRGRIVAIGPAAAGPRSEGNAEPKGRQPAAAMPASASDAPATPTEGPKVQAAAKSETSGQQD